MSSLPAAARRLRRRLPKVSGGGSGSAPARLEARQRGPLLELTLTPRPGVRPVAVWAQGARGWTELAPVAAAGEAGYRAEVDLARIPGAGPETFVLHLEIGGEGSGTKRVQLAG